MSDWEEAWNVKFVIPLNEVHNATLEYSRKVDESIKTSFRTGFEAGQKSNAGRVGDAVTTIMNLESEKAALEKELEEVKIQRDNFLGQNILQDMSSNESLRMENCQYKYDVCKLKEQNQKLEDKLKRSRELIKTYTDKYVDAISESDLPVVEMRRREFGNPIIDMWCNGKPIAGEMDKHSSWLMLEDLAIRYKAIKLVLKEAK